MTDIVFIHGLWISHTAWQPWIEHFAANGYGATAPPWPGEADTVVATRQNAGAQAGFGINEITEHFAGIVEQFDTAPVAIGHSFGGLIAQKLLGQNKVSAAVAIDPAPIKGVKPLPLAQLRSAFPVLGNPLNHGRSKALTQKQFRYGFGNALSEDESDALWEQRAIPSPGKPLFEAAIANFAPNSPAKRRRQRHSWATADHRGHRRPHGASGERQGCLHAVREVDRRYRFPRVRRARALTDDRPRLARCCRRRTDLAGRQGNYAVGQRFLTRTWSRPQGEAAIEVVRRIRALRRPQAPSFGRRRWRLLAAASAAHSFVPMTTITQ